MSVCVHYACKLILINKLTFSTLGQSSLLENAIVFIYLFIFLTTQDMLPVEMEQKLLFHTLCRQSVLMIIENIRK